MIVSQINKKLILLKMHYFMAIGGCAPLSPFLPTMAKQRGYSAFVVGLIFSLQSIPGLMAKVIFGMLTDKYNCRRSVFISTTIVTLLLVGAMLSIPGKDGAGKIDDSDVVGSPLFWLFCVTVSMFTATTMVKGVLTDTICMCLLGKNKHKYGEQRVWGSVSYSVTALVSGACVDWYSKGEKSKNYTPGFIIALIFFLLDIFVVWKMKIAQERGIKNVSSGIKNVLSKVKVQAFILWVVLFGIFTSFISSFVFWYLEDLVSIYHPEKEPWIKTLQGLFLINQCFLGEVPSFILSGYLLKYVDHMTMFTLMFFMYALTFFLYSMITNPIFVVPVGIIVGVTFALTYSAAISYADFVAPSGVEGTLQGIVGTALYGIGSPIGCFIGGYLFKHFGSFTTYRILSFCALFTCIGHIMINYLIQRFFTKENTKEKMSCTTQPKDINVNENLTIL